MKDHYCRELAIFAQLCYMCHAVEHFFRRMNPSTPAVCLNVVLKVCALSE